MDNRALERMRTRARAVRARAATQSWSYRQRNLAAGVWFRLRRVLADAQAAYEISGEEARQLVVEGYRPEQCGREVVPEKTILFVDPARLSRLATRRPIRVGLGPDFLAATNVALVRFGDEQDEPHEGQNLRERALRAAELLARDPRVKLVYLFGSAALDRGPVPRDLDLAVWSDPPWSFDEQMRRQADLVMAINGPVDLVLLHDASVILAYEIVESGRCLFARDSDLETEFVTRARARYWDFKPYRDEQWRLSGRRAQQRLETRSGPET